MKARSLVTALLWFIVATACLREKVGGTGQQGLRSRGGLAIDSISRNVHQGGLPSLSLSSVEPSILEAHRIVTKKTKRKRPKLKITRKTAPMMTKKKNKKKNNITMMAKKRKKKTRRRRKKKKKKPMKNKKNKRKKNPLKRTSSELALHGGSKTGGGSECEGDCRVDSQCDGRFMCWQRKYESDFLPVPGCSGFGVAGRDYCFDPWKLNPGPGDLFGYSTGTGLDECQGICNSNADCEGSLVCSDRDHEGSLESVPGCSGVGIPGLNYCYNQITSNPSTASPSKTQPPTTITSSPTTASPSETQPPTTQTPILTPVPTTQQKCSETLACSQALTYNDVWGGTMPYRLFLPPEIDNVEPDSMKKFPLAIFMHGAGTRGTDNIQHVQGHISGLIDATQTPEYASILLAPQIPLGEAWWSYYSSSDYTLEILSDVIRLYPVDINRIYVTGFSMGGFGATFYVKVFPELFAAAIPMSGATQLSTEEAVSISEVPFWLFHGDQDRTNPVATSRNFVAALESVGGNVKYTELEGQGHAIWSSIYDDWRIGSYRLYPWMLSQSRNQTVPIASRTLHQRRVTSKKDGTLLFPDEWLNKLLNKKYHEG